MLDITLIRENPEIARQNIRVPRWKSHLDGVLELDEQRRTHCTAKNPLVTSGDPSHLSLDCVYSMASTIGQ